MGPIVFLLFILIQHPVRVNLHQEERRNLTTELRGVEEEGEEEEKGVGVRYQSVLARSQAYLARSPPFLKTPLQLRETPWFIILPPW